MPSSVECWELRARHDLARGGPSRGAAPNCSVIATCAAANASAACATRRLSWGDAPHRVRLLVAVGEQSLDSLSHHWNTLG